MTFYFDSVVEVYLWHLVPWVPAVARQIDAEPLEKPISNLSWAAQSFLGRAWVLVGVNCQTD